MSPIQALCILNSVVSDVLLDNMQGNRMDFIELNKVGQRESR